VLRWGKKKGLRSGVLYVYISGIFGVFPMLENGMWFFAVEVHVFNASLPSTTKRYENMKVG